MLSFAVLDHQGKIGVPGIDREHSAHFACSRIAAQKFKPMLPNRDAAKKGIA
jgi:hypothetical protein